MSTKLVCDSCYETIFGAAVGERMSVSRGASMGAGPHYDLCLSCWNKAAEVLHLPKQEVTR